MPDILIRGMEMPKGDPVHLTICSNGAAFLHVYENGYGALVRCQCCAVELPPHGDLIDRDYIKRRVKPYSPEDEKSAVTIGTAIRLIQKALDVPVIVPASEEANHDEP